MWSFVTLLSPRVTSFQGRNTLDAGFAPGLELRIPHAHPAHVMLDALERVMALRDPATAAHALRVRRLAVAVAEAACAGDHELIAAIHAAAPLHDIGKLAIPDRLLHKPGPLSPDEYELVKRHAVMGADMLSAIEYAGPIARIIRHHHENWDGTGYPDALRGEAIPLGARILAVVDCYDALTSERPYRESLSHANALAMIAPRRGTMYDPAILDAFMHVVQGQRSSEPIRSRELSPSPYRRHQVRPI